MLTKVFSAAVNGLQAQLVTIEVNIARGVMFTFSGLADTAVRESRDRIKAAVTNLGFRFPMGEITVNMAPADIRKEGSSYDLPLAVGLLAAEGSVDVGNIDDCLLVGELRLDGRLQSVRGVLSIAILARNAGYKRLIVPSANVYEAAVVNGIDVYGMDTLADVMKYLGGAEGYKPVMWIPVRYLWNIRCIMTTISLMSAVRRV